MRTNFPGECVESPNRAAVTELVEFVRDLVGIMEGNNRARWRLYHLARHVGPTQEDHACGASRSISAQVSTVLTIFCLFLKTLGRYHAAGCASSVAVLEVARIFVSGAVQLHGFFPPADLSQMLYFWAA